MSYITTHIYFALCALLGTMLLGTGCANNPATGGANVVMSSAGGEKSMGSTMHRELLESGALYNDPELQAYIDQVGQGLVRSSDKPDARFTFTVIDSPDINAFALPGGYVYINRGLLAYLDNEAELAGVLAHEIAHVTARHHGRQKTGDVTNKVLATTVYILTGSGDLADASSMYGTELISGYGREMELEADGLGARYMHNAGYDTDALLEVIGVLKTQEQYQRTAARNAGRRGTYHGLYATHPRNDKRLKQVVNTAGELDLETYVENPELPGVFKQHLQGLVWGDSIQSDRAENRYYHSKLAFTFEKPAGWKVDTTSQSIIATSPGNQAKMAITVRHRDNKLTPREVLEESVSGKLSEKQELEQAGLAGYTAIASNEGLSRRVAVIDFNKYSYRFQGEADSFGSEDQQLLAIIESFRPSHPKERESTKGQRIEYLQIPRGTTIASLAGNTPIADAESQLRLINGLYPRGEPRTGDWIKIIR